MCLLSLTRIFVLKSWIRFGASLSMRALLWRPCFTVLSKSRAYYLLLRQVWIIYLKQPRMSVVMFSQISLGSTQPLTPRLAQDVQNQWNWQHLALNLHLGAEEGLQVLKRSPLPGSLALSSSVPAIAPWPQTAVWLYCPAQGSLDPLPGRRGPSEGRCLCRRWAFQVYPVLTGSHVATSWGVLPTQKGGTGPDTAGEPTDLPPSLLFWEPRDLAMAYHCVLLRHQQEDVSLLSLLRQCWSVSSISHDHGNRKARWKTMAGHDPLRQAGPGPQEHKGLATLWKGKQP